MKKEEEFLKTIEQNQGIFQKLIGLYAFEYVDKEDLYQEMLLQIWKAFDRFEGNSKISTWLYKICLNTALNYRRKGNKHNHQAINETEVHNITDKKPETHEALYMAIISLDDIDKMLITLHLEGYKNKEIAEISGVNPNHLNVKIHRIKKRLAELIKKYEHV